MLILNYRLSHMLLLPHLIYLLFLFQLWHTKDVSYFPVSSYFFGTIFMTVDDVYSGGAAKVRC